MKLQLRKQTNRQVCIGLINELNHTKVTHDFTQTHTHTHTHTHRLKREGDRERQKNSAQAPLHFGLTIKLMELDVVHRKLQVKGSIKYSRCKLMSLIKKYIQNLKLLYCSQSSIVSSSIHRVLLYSK